MASAALFRPGFLDFYKHGHFSDVTILTQSGSYRAHRMVLAFSSEFFEAMLLSEFQETHTAVIDLRNTFDPRDIFPEVLKILYSGRIDITRSTAVPLLAMSDVLLIASIQTKCNEYIATHLNKKTALEFLLQAIELHQERLASQCLKVLACNFIHICDDTDFSGLDLETFVQLICHERLAVKSEWKLYQVILRFLDSYRKNASDTNEPRDFTNQESDLVLQLMKNVRFFFFTYDQLVLASQSSFVPKQLLVAPLLARLQPYEAPKAPVPADNAYATRLSRGIQFEIGGLAPVLAPSLGSDPAPSTAISAATPTPIPQGIMYWLGTKEGTQSQWQSPVTVGTVAVHASSVERGHPPTLLDREPLELWTQDVPASWLSVDLGRFRVLPHAYMLRHGGNYKADSLRNWDFQGSTDGKVWVVLKRHSHDTSLSSPFATATFVLDKPATVPYQWFRIIQTGHNSSNHNFLVLSGLELFGELWDKDAINPPNSA